MVLEVLSNSQLQALDLSYSSVYVFDLQRSSNHRQVLCKWVNENTNQQIIQRLRLGSTYIWYTGISPDRHDPNLGLTTLYDIRYQKEKR